jgi:hypothetical protein
VLGFLACAVLTLVYLALSGWQLSDLLHPIRRGRLHPEFPFVVLAPLFIGLPPALMVAKRMSDEQTDRLIRWTGYGFLWTLITGAYVALHVLVDLIIKDHMAARLHMEPHSIFTTAVATLVVIAGFEHAKDWAVRTARKLAGREESEPALDKVETYAEELRLAKTEEIPDLVARGAASITNGSAARVQLKSGSRAQVLSQCGELERLLGAKVAPSETSLRNGFTVVIEVAGRPTPNWAKRVGWSEHGISRQDRHFLKVWTAVSAVALQNCLRPGRTSGPFAWPRPKTGRYRDEGLQSARRHREADPSTTRELGHSRSLAGRK